MNNLRPYKDHRPVVGAGVYIDQGAHLIGDVVLNNDVSIWPMVVIRGDVNHIRIGARTNIQDGSVLHVARPTTQNSAGHALIIGEDVTVGHKAMLHGCTIGNLVLIGMGAIIMDGVIIEDNVIVGAGALVSPGKKLDSGFLYLGNPARKVRALTIEEKESLIRSSLQYVKLKNEYLDELTA